MQTCKLLSALGTCTLITTGASAAIVQPVGVDAAPSFNAGVAAVNLINGTAGTNGLSAESLAATHGENSNSNGQYHTLVGVTGDIDITFDLGGTFDLTSAHIWQHNQTGSFGRGVDQFDILVSSNGTDFTEVVTDTTLAISTGGDITAQVVGLVQSGVTHVRFHVDTNHGDLSVVGLSEVRFDAVPEPGSLALLGLGGLLIARRRRG